jgi:methanogenic corrinoid protein MtbC1
MYSADDIRHVTRILTLLEEGHSLPAIARQLHSGQTGALHEEEPAGQSGVWAGYLNDTLRAIEDFSTERLEAVFNDASSLYPVEMVTERLIEPVLHELGNRWRVRDTGIAEEHFYTAWVRNRLGARFHHAVGQARGARIVCAGLPGSYHDIGMLLFALAALSRGYRVLHLGADLPLEQLPRVLERSASRGVVLGARNTIGQKLQRELATLAGSLGVPLLLGGSCSDRPLDAFEAAGGVRLGSRISVALRVLDSHVPAFGGGSDRSVE